MNDAREAFLNLRTVSGRGVVTTDVYRDLEAVERRVSTYRMGRVVAVALATTAVVAGFAAGASLLASAAGGPVGQITAPSSPSGTPADVATDAAAGPTQGGPALDSPACREAQVVPGKPAGRIGGLEGWFNSTPIAPCGEWPTQVLDHPDTVLINTTDGTMVEAYFRTSREALGVYGTLTGDYAVPDPDPSWPADSLVLIDARTGELLESTPVADLDQS